MANMSAHESQADQVQPTDTVSIRFTGQEIVCPPRLSVAAALTRAGYRVFRTTPTGAGRGVFCGMGICQDCIVTINGVPNQCACMTIVRAGMTIETQLPRP